jgi:hypothetical protein
MSVLWGFSYDSHSRKMKTFTRHAICVKVTLYPDILTWYNLYALQHSVGPCKKAGVE